MERRFKLGKFTGPLRLDGSELTVDYGTGKTIFIEHQNDLWAEDVKSAWIAFVLDHCKSYPDNHYVFQTKNPSRYSEFIRELRHLSCTIGCTVETDNWQLLQGCSKAPLPLSRLVDMKNVGDRLIRHPVFITVEPIMCMVNPREFARQIAKVNPSFINVGADSKGTGLTEPSEIALREFLDELHYQDVFIRQKHNLGRLLQ